MKVSQTPRAQMLDQLTGQGNGNQIVDTYRTTKPLEDGTGALTCVMDSEVVSDEPSLLISYQGQGNGMPDYILVETLSGRDTMVCRLTAKTDASNNFLIVLSAASLKGAYSSL